MTHLEERYVVLKLSMIPREKQIHMMSYLRGLGVLDSQVRGLVIEEDWPEYDATMNLLLERINEEASD